MAVLGGSLVSTKCWATSQTWSVTGSKTLVVNVPCNLRVQLGTNARIEVDAEAQVLSALVVTIVGGVATLDSPKGFRSKRSVAVVATMPTLDRLSLNSAVQAVLAPMKLLRLAVEMDGSSSVALEDFRADELKADMRGASSMSGKGEVGAQAYRIEGAGTVLMRKLRGNHVRVVIVGSGNAEVAANTELFVDISGMGSVAYEGRPKLVKNLQGIGSVDPL